LHEISQTRHRPHRNVLAGRVFETPDFDGTTVVTAQFISELLIKLSTVF